VICFDDGDASEFNTLLVTTGSPHAFRGACQELWRSGQTFSRIPLQNLWIFQGTLPGDLASDRAAISRPAAFHPVNSSIGLAHRLRPRNQKAAAAGCRQQANFTVRRGSLPRW